MTKCEEVVAALRALAAERAGDGPGGPNYDPELLLTLTEAADLIEALEPLAGLGAVHMT